MPRGGKTTPPARTGPSGPGRFSRRTDGQQIATPGLGKPGPGGTTSLEYGDVQALREAQKAAPLPVGTPPPRVRAGRPQAGGMPTTGRRLSPHLLTMEPEDPNEPTTAGLDVGQGPGSEVLGAPRPAPDIRELVLERLAYIHGNVDAKMVLNRLRSERAATAAPVRPNELPQSPAEPGVPEPAPEAQ